MIKNRTTETALFESLVNSQREQVIYWLKSKYEHLSYWDAEDIVIDAAYALWEKLKTVKDWVNQSQEGLFRVIAKNTYTHWLQKKHGIFSAEWDDSYYPHDEGVELDYCYVSSETAHMLLKERMYDLIDQLKPKDRELMLLYLQNVRMDEIAEKLGLKNQQVAKNKKRKIVVRLCEAINGQADACPSFFKIHQSHQYICDKRHFLMHFECRIATFLSEQ